MKKFHILFSVLVVVFISLVVILKIHLLGGKHLSPYILFAVLFIISTILIIVVENKRKMLLISISYLFSYIVIILSLFHIFNWPNHDREYISIPKDYTSFQWQINEPNTVDFDTEKLSSILKKAETIDNLRSVLIVKDKKLVVEHYYHGCTKNNAFNIFSTTQAFMSSLIGIAIDNGVIGSEHDKIIDYFPHYKDKDYVSDKTDLTIEHLLTNTAGLSGDGRESSFNSFNWTKSTLKRPKIGNTGKHYFQQQTGHLLSGIITEASSKNTKDFAEKYLCKPLGIHIIDWFKSPEGIYRGSNALYVTSRDLARYGDLYLSKGKLDGKQIISESWINKSQKVSIDLNFKITENFTISGVGYSCLTGKIHGYDVFLFGDMQGVFIINIPYANITIVTTRYKTYDYQLIEELICEIISTIK